ncbi:hypothetical protein OG909_09060 [Streptomyces sp. NBC_01754]|uniref:hypothetical protein n=1 Tax=Streptomyces sp. NBC_01754 TaxID=2975930 RepID=UPI002DDB0D11|nr:hypothetical protein [Streptomyces sp. NBC_01754]WSC92427.1 hypothetical protein OG909_09060 [Streptomyces sp. NBC_01754]
MKFRPAALTTALLIMAIGGSACGSGSGDGGKSDTTTQNRASKMDAQQATDRAEEILHQAVDGMSPKPQLKSIGPATVGPCLMDDGNSSADRKQVILVYQLTDVPGSAGNKLVRQARDAWVKQGYKFKSAEPDWSKPYPKLFMHTTSDDFWMDAIVGATNKETGEGIAAITITSPCFSAEGSETNSAVSTSESPTSDSRVLEHSSRIFEALRVQHQPKADDGISRVKDGEDLLTHHTWSTVPLSHGPRTEAIDRARDSLHGAGWAVRVLPLGNGNEAILARHQADGSLARVAPANDGSVRAAVTTVDNGDEARVGAGEDVEGAHQARP